LSSFLLRGFESPSLRQISRIWGNGRDEEEKKGNGDVAQLGEHLVRNEGVGGSNPLISTSYLETVLGGEVAVP
jgi:hypothetical protein